MPAIMLPPSSASAAELVHPLACDPLKQIPRHLYVRQPHAFQIIQLVEESPPPPLPHPISSLTPSSSAASSCPSTSESEDEGCSSYCSSVVTPDESSHSEPIPWTDDTHSIRMKRVHAWRDGFVKATTTCAPSEPRASSLKRKSNAHQTDDDTVLHTSKRPRSRDGHSISRLTGHPCPACDILFPTPASLQKHGRAPDVPEACRAAVEYNFE